ncbi:MAG: phosphatase PAP2 family protein [Chloracidobacterium sp.]|nr:phosphatase PAP2 family protein [Chloracidobacterium sp.]
MRAYDKHTIGVESVRYRTKNGVGTEENHLKKITNIALLALGGVSGIGAIIAYILGDISITRFIQRFDERYFYKLMVAVSWPGYLGRQWIAALFIVALLLRFRLRIEAACLLLSAMSSWLLVNAIKLIIERRRPSPDMVKVFEHPVSWSFPSGHVASYMALYGFLFYMVYSLMRPSPLRYTLLIVCGAMISLIGVSRVYLGAHWASDVFGGYSFGFFWLSLTIYVYRRSKNTESAEALSQ